MFIHQGKSRTLLHNLRIATFLSLVAGIVNVVGFLAIRQLTTNVTGHFALWKWSLYSPEVEQSGVRLTTPSILAR